MTTSATIQTATVATKNDHRSSYVVLSMGGRFFAAFIFDDGTSQNWGSFKTEAGARRKVEQVRKMNGDA